MPSSPLSVRLFENAFLFRDAVSSDRDVRAARVFTHWTNRRPRCARASTGTSVARSPTHDIQRESLMDPALPVDGLRLRSRGHAAPRALPIAVPGSRALLFLAVSI